MKLEGNYIYFDNKNNKSVELDSINITLPNYINRSFSKYRINVEEKSLERLCMLCNCWHSVAFIDSSSFEFVPNKDKMEFLGSNTGFNAKCINCLNKKKEVIESSLNIYIPIELKMYYEILSTQSNESLKDTVTLVLKEYKDQHPLGIKF